MTTHNAVASLLLFLLALPVHAALFKWTDENGVTHFGQYPPAGVEAERLRAPPPPATDPAAARQRLDQTLEQRRTQAEERRQAEQKAADEAGRQAQRQKACQAARDDLATLQRGGHHRVRLPDGSVTYLNDEQRRQRIDKAKARIKAACP